MTNKEKHSLIAEINKLPSEMGLVNKSFVTGAIMRQQTPALKQLDTDEVLTLLHDAPGVGHGYTAGGDTFTVSEPSYVISQSDLVKFVNFIRSQKG